MRLPERTGDQIRFGISILVPPPAGPELQAAREAIGDLLAPAIPAHVTLLGPTVVETEEHDLVVEHLEQVASRHEPFHIHLRGTGTFRPVSPVVFVQLAQGIPGCERLEADIRSGPLAQPLRFNYHPHVTVAHEVGAEALDRAFAELAGYEAHFDVTAFQLFHHGDDGVWRPARDFTLTG